MTAFKLTKILTFNGLYAARTLFPCSWDGIGFFLPPPPPPAPPTPARKGRRERDNGRDDHRGQTSKSGGLNRYFCLHDGRLLRKMLP